MTSSYEDSIDGDVDYNDDSDEDTPGPSQRGGRGCGARGRGDRGRASNGRSQRQRRAGNRDKTTNTLSL